MAIDFRFPVLTDVPREQWPAVVGCACGMPREPRDLFDTRAIPELPDVTCVHCLPHAVALGRVTWGGMARALKAPPLALASYDHADTEGRRLRFVKKSQSK